MNRLQVSLLAIVFAMLGNLGCSTAKSTDGTAQAQTPTANWAAKMQGMSSNLEELMPYVFSKNEFSDPENGKKIKKMIGRFQESVALVPKHAGEQILGKDPIIRFSINRLAANTDHAARAFEEGHVEFSRTLLRENMGLCFSCHTTTTMGPQNNFAAKGLPTKFRIYPTEKADYYVATRQYDKAVEALEVILKNPTNIYDDPHELVSALRKYLALQVRVKKDSARAASSVESFLSHAQLPYFISVDAENWLKSLRDWQRERPRENQSQLEQAKRLLDRAHRMQGVTGYQSAYVEYLRASSALRDALQASVDDKSKAAAYQLLGRSYETLSEMGTWDLPEVYFEACVRMSPGTNTAKECYRDFEKTIILGFSGSAGLFIPKEERARMAELKSIAGIKDTKPQ